MKKKRFTTRAAAVLLLFGLCFSVLYTNAYAAEKEEVDEIIASIPAAWPAPPMISAQSAVLLDADSGEILYAKDATKAMFPASTTKLMTALVTLENSSLQDVVDFPFEAVNIPAGSSHIGMRRNEQMVLKECLYGLLLPSANEVANALAIHVSGATKTFVVKMNERAYQLGCVNTTFANANGLHMPEHYTCAYDLAKIMQGCSDNSVFLEVASSQSYVHHADELLNKDIPMTNTHMMIRPSSEYYNEYVVCGKTGHTDESGYNLVTYAEKEGTRLIAVVMGCQDGGQYVSTQSLLDYGFNYFHKVLPAELDTSLNMENAFTDSPLAIPTPDVSLLSLDSTDSILLPDTVTFDDLSKEVVDTDAGKIITYTYENYPLGSVTLRSGNDNHTAVFYSGKQETEFTTESAENLAMIDGWLLVTLVLMSGLLFAFIFFSAKWLLPKKKFK